jgi:hypothetical protein
MGINSKTWQPDVEYGHKGKKIIRSSWSLCPRCIEEEKYGQAKIPSVIYENEGEVWQEKYCGRHGVVREVYWEDYEMYSRASKYRDDGLVIQNPKITKKRSCPLGCGLCTSHRSHTALGNIVVTNRCNLACWYCFFYAREGGWVYEPTLKQIEEMLLNLKETKPVGAEVVQLTGGEPTLRQDLMEIIKMARRTGYQHIMLNTNGVRLAFNPGLVEQITRAGSSRGGDIILYMSFDGVSPETNSKNYWETPRVIESCRKAGLQIVLVPTVIRGVNDHEVGDIVRFAVANMDVVRGVNFQPVSLVGRMPGEEREAKRITIPGVIKALENQLGYTLTGNDFFPVPCVTPLTDFLEALSGKRMYRLSIHFACGMATYLLKHRGILHPITHFIDIDGLMSSLKKCKDRPGALATLEMLLSLRRHVKRTPEKFSLKEMLYSGFFKAEYTPFLELQRNAFFIGMMHFQDLYNYDVERVRRCGIHYATPDGRIIPFCAFNVLPGLYRDEIQKRFATPVVDWEADKDRKLADDRYVRRFSAKEKEEIADYYHRCIGKGSKILGTPHC